MKKMYLKYYIPIFILTLLGIISIFLSKTIISDSYSYLYRQITYIGIGILFMYIINKINFNYIKKHSLILYILTLLLLVYVLIFGKGINGSKSWINIFGLSFQPSEFAKVTLLLVLDKYIKTKYGIVKGIIFLIIPTILTFLQPDTGTVLFYIIIFFSIFISLKLKKRYYIGLLLISLTFIFLYFYLYFLETELFINIFGTSFFYRTDRILNFMKSEGFQLNNALIGIGNGNIIGNIGEYVIYIPEAITDFMFANILMNLGFLGGIIVLINFFIIDIFLIKDIKLLKNNYFIIGLFGLFLYQQIQHILMNIGLLPITGITLPFISFGGSSLISYFILFGILFNIKKYPKDT